MANTYTRIIYHAVFATKGRMPCIHEERREDLFAYVWGIHKNLKCHLYRIGGVTDHIHILAAIHSKLALADYISELKTSSTSWIRRENIFRSWPGWQDGYGAFSISYSDKDRLIEYIKGQPEHHQRVSFLEEYQALLEQAGIKFDPKYLE